MEYLTSSIQMIHYRIEGVTQIFHRIPSILLLKWLKTFKMMTIFLDHFNVLYVEKLENYHKIEYSCCLDKTHSCPFRTGEKLRRFFYMFYFKKSLHAATNVLQASLFLHNSTPLRFFYRNLAVIVVWCGETWDKYYDLIRRRRDVFRIVFPTELLATQKIPCFKNYLNFACIYSNNNWPWSLSHSEKCTLQLNQYNRLNFSFLLRSAERDVKRVGKQKSIIHITLLKCTGASVSQIDISV